jgi:ABC-2 type transport system permease protein
VALAAATIIVVIVVSWVAGAGLADGSQALGLGDARPALIGLFFLTIGLTVLGYAIGLLVRNSAGAICLLLLWPLVAEGLIAGLMAVANKDSWQRWLPYVAGINMTSVGDSSDTLDRVPGGLYFFAWVAVLLALGIVKTRRRDA